MKIQLKQRFYHFDKTRSYKRVVEVLYFCKLFRQYFYDICLTIFLLYFLWFRPVSWRPLDCSLTTNSSPTNKGGETENYFWTSESRKWETVNPICSRFQPSAVAAVSKYVKCVKCDAALKLTSIGRRSPFLLIGFVWQTKLWTKWMNFQWFSNGVGVHFWF